MKKILLLAITSLVSQLALSATIINNPDGTKTHLLRMSETISGEMVGRWDRITCGGNQNNPGPIPVPPPNHPQPPPPPPPQNCQANSAVNSITQVWNEAQRLNNGKCMRTVYVDYCSDNLEDHALADTKIAFSRILRNAKIQAENVCRRIGNSCNQSEVMNVVRSFRDMAQFVSSNYIRISGQQYRMVDDYSLLNLNCH